MARRTGTWIWVGRVIAALCLAGVAGYLVTVGLEKADKLASVLGGLAALTALAAPYLLPSPRRRTARRSPDNPPPAQPPPPAVDLRGAQGVQVNQSGGNTQTNTFNDPR